MNDVLLKVEGIRKAFPGVVALDDVSFDLRRGEVHALVGENGAGKSTLMKIMSGVEQPDEGTIIYKGNPVRFSDTEEARRAGISIIFQELNLIPHLSVAQNIYVGHEPRTRFGTLDERKMTADAQAILNRLKLQISPGAEVRHLPISQQQMVEIAKALSHKSEVLIMDEPTSALTENEIVELFSVVRNLREEGVGIIYISHRLEELKHIVDRISVFRDGKHIGTDQYANLTVDEIVNRMVGRKLDKQFPQRRNIPTDDVILEVRNLRRKNFVKDVSFSLCKGEILGLSGLMGAGRTELARTIFGAEAAEEGEIYLNGKKLNVRTPADAIDQGIAYLSENRKHDGIAVRMGLRENVTMANMAEVCGFGGIVSGSAEVKIAKKYVDELSIKTTRVDQIVNNLSGGNQQKVVIAKWLFTKARILIFDEPTRGIDVGAKYAIYQLMEKLACDGVGIIMISSELPEIMGMTDRVLVLHEGMLVASLKTSETNQEEILTYAAGLDPSSLSADSRNEKTQKGIGKA